MPAKKITARKPCNSWTKPYRRPPWCTRIATTTRPSWRWGQEGETLIVHVVLHLCEECAAVADENAETGRAEAAAS